MKYAGKRPDLDKSTALDKRTPDEAYFDGKEMMKAA